MRDIARAIEKGDPEAAADACMRHVHQAANAAEVNLVKFGGIIGDAGPAPGVKRKRAAAPR
jgi:hypothetical protein